MTTIRSLAIVCGLLATSAPALAAPIPVTFGDTLQVKFQGVNPGQGNAGMYNWTTGTTTYAGLVYSNPATNSFVTFCVEQTEYTSGSMAPYKLLALEDGPNPGPHMTTATANALRAMWAQYFDEVDTNEEAAAFQQAVWHLMAGGGATPPTGAFRLTSRYLDSNSWNSGFANLGLLSNLGLQDQIVQLVPAPAEPVPTPEPGMLALALLVVPAVYLRRKLVKGKA